MRGNHVAAPIDDLRDFCLYDIGSTDWKYLHRKEHNQILQQERTNLGFEQGGDSGCQVLNPESLRLECAPAWGAPSGLGEDDGMMTRVHQYLPLHTPF